MVWSRFQPTAKESQASRLEVRASWGLLATQAVIFIFLFFGKLSSLVNAEGDLAGHAALGSIELCAAGISLYLLSGSAAAKLSRLDWLGGLLAVLTAAMGFAAYSSTLFALYLILRDRNDLPAKAAGAVALAIAIQAVWAPLIFAKLSFIFLQIDAGMVGWLLGYVVPGSVSNGTIVITPGGHDVIITAACASFHNLSLASLCWVTLTMLHRSYWIRSDLYVGIGAMLIQFALNIWRLVFVCMSLPMYEFWHEGLGKHIFSGVATACAVAFVQLFLVRLDQRGGRGQVAVAHPGNGILS
jgi:hypothetical protein